MNGFVAINLASRSGMTLVLLIATTGTAVAGQEVAGQEANQRAAREQIGEVLGKPVYRDQIREGEGRRLDSELLRLFVSPIMQQYRRDHAAELEPTQAEIQKAAAHFQQAHRERMEKETPEERQKVEEALEKGLAELDLPDEKKREVRRLTLETMTKPPGEQFAKFMLDNWKLQRHLYDRFGGGRILWQQAGLEAFDAMHQWIRQQEQDGKFKINDPALRSSMYEYWTTMKHGSFLFDDADRVRTEFLEPPWAPQPDPPQQAPEPAPDR